MAVKAQQLSLEQFLLLPEKKPALEFADGVVTQKVSPQGEHSLLQFRLARYLDDAGRGTVATFTELRITFAGVSRVPDIAVYRRERIPVAKSGRVANDFREPPDIAVEIVSPRQSVTSLVRRCLWYVENGVAVALLVDPKDESVLVFRPGKPPSALTDGDRVELREVIPELKLTAGELFESLKP
jgi:Uma2 family endonuclease